MIGLSRLLPGLQGQWDISSNSTQSTG